MKTAAWLCMLSVCLLLQACGGVEYQDYDYYAMNTVITVRVPKESAVGPVGQRITELENLLSRTVVASDISRFNLSAEGASGLSPETMRVLHMAVDMAEASGGLYDPTIAPLVELWNIDGREGTVPAAEDIEEARMAVGYEKLIFDGAAVSKADPDVKLDLGGVGKGYACQAVVELLRDNQVEYGIVSFGGNVGVFGVKEDGSQWKIAVKNPIDTADVVGYICFDGGEPQYIAVSGDYERYFEADGVRYHHILDPRTGYPAESGIRSVAVLCSDGAEADALSTALFVMGYEQGYAFYQSGMYEFEAVFVTDSGLYPTDGLTGGGKFEWKAKDTQ